MAPVARSEQGQGAAKKNYTMMIVGVIVILVVVAAALGFVYKDKLLGQSGEKMEVLSADDASAKLVDFINEVWGEQIGPVTLKEVKETSGIYEVKINMKNGEEMEDQTVFVTKDAKIFIPSLIDIETMKANADQLKAQEAQPGAEQPAVEVTE